MNYNNSIIKFVTIRNASDEIKDSNKKTIQPKTTFTNSLVEILASEKTSADKISKYYPIIEKAGKSGELPFTYVAMMLDRKLTGEQKPQIYGTQLGMRIINKDGKQENFVYVLPIEDAKNVNLRRIKAGFETTVEENARKFGVEYKEFTYDELEKIK